MAKRDKMMFDDFNSIKVRLKRISFIGFTYSLQYFNSIKVRLKPSKQGHHFFHFLFQFHKGTIKTGRGDVNYKGKITFQFHKGTIKTV